MTRINHHALGASRRLPPRITLLASSTKYKFKEERKRILKLSVKKLRSIEDPEAFLSKSVLINNTLKRLQTEVREEKAERKKCAELPSYNPSPYSFYSIEKAYREEMERMDNNGNNPDPTSSFGSSGAGGVGGGNEVFGAPLHSANHESAQGNNNSNMNTVVHHSNLDPSAYVSYNSACHTDQHMLDADDEDSGSGEEDNSNSSTSGDSSSSDEECDTEISNTTEKNNLNNCIEMSSSLSQSSEPVPPIINANINGSSSGSSNINEMNSVEDDLLSEVYMPTPSMPPPHDPIDDHGSGIEPGTLGIVPMRRPSTPVPWSTHSNLDNSPDSNPGKSGGSSSSKLLTNPSAVAVINSSEISGCDNEDLWSEAVRTECWTKPVAATPVAPSSVSIRTTLTASSTVNTNTMSLSHWPNSIDWPTYTPSNGQCSTSESSSSSASPASTASINSAQTASNFSPNISALPVTLQCSQNSHLKENLFSATVHAATAASNQSSSVVSSIANSVNNQNSLSIDGLDNRSKQSPSQSSHSSAPSSLSDKCYSCGQSSLFQSELQSVVFNSLIASLET